nr:hypothetical protein [Tanacetum cinerariifolium]
VKASTDKSLGEDASKQRRNDDKIKELNLTDGANTEVTVEDKGSREKGSSTADQVSTARPEKVKEKGVAFRDMEEPPRLTRSTTTLQPLPTIDTKDKGGHTPRSDEGRPNLIELMDICTQLSNRVLALEEAKTTQDKVITRLKLRVGRIEKEKKGKDFTTYEEKTV